MASTYYLKLDGITGESTAPAHKGEIQVFSFSFGASATGGTNGQPPGKPNFGELSIMKTADKASPLLLRALALGSAIKSATLSSVKSNVSPSISPFTIALTNVHVTSLQDSGSSEAPSESVSFQYDTITYTDTPTTSSGTAGTPVSFSYNIVTESGN